jgi:hypothetical protein
VHGRKDGEERSKYVECGEGAGEEAEGWEWPRETWEDNKGEEGRDKRYEEGG